MATATVDRLAEFTRQLDQLAPSRTLPALAAAAEKSSALWAGVVDQLQSLRHLERDWDGMGAEAPTAEVVDFTMWLTVTLQQHQPGFVPCRAVAGPNATVVVEWQGEGYRYEVEIVAPFHVETLLLIEGQPPKHRVLKI